MNIRDRVHLTPQDSLCLNSLAVLRLSPNELKRIDTHSYHLQADEVSLPAEDGNPRTVEIGVKIEKKRLNVC